MAGFVIQSVVNVKCDSTKCSQDLNLPIGAADSTDEKKIDKAVTKAALENGWGSFTLRKSSGTSFHLLCKKCVASFERRFNAETPGTPETVEPPKVVDPPKNTGGKLPTVKK